MSLALVERHGTRGKVLYARGYVNGKYINRSTGHIDKAMAKVVADKIEASIHADTGHSLGWALELYLRRPKKVGKNTLRYVEDFVADNRRMAIEDVKPSTLLSHVYHPAKAPATLRREINSIQGFVNFARELEGLAAIRVRKPADTEPKSSIYTDDERDLLLATCKEMKPWFYPLMLSYFYTGARRSELLQLEWRHVERDRKTGEPKLIILRSQKGRTGRINIRRIPIHDIIKPYFMKEKGRTVFKNNGGHSQVSPSLMHFTWQTVSRACGLGHLTQHDARRTFATKLLASGVSDHRIADLLGHIDTKMLKTYAVVDDDLRLDAVLRLD